MDEQLSQLEQRLDALIEKMENLREENQQLLKKQSLLKTNQFESAQQNKQTATKVKSIIDRLKSLEVPA